MLKKFLLNYFLALFNIINDASATELRRHMLKKKTHSSSEDVSLLSRLFLILS